MAVKPIGYNTNRVLLVLLFVTILLLSSCTKMEDVFLPAVADYEIPPEIERKELKLGVLSGPYDDMFMDAMEPFLAEKGYSIELVYYDDYIRPNTALANYEIDMNMFQHYKHLSNSKIEYNLALSSITEIPTASMGVFSSKYESLEALGDNILVSIPKDSTNLARALQVLESAGLISIDPSIDKTKATTNNLTKNQHNITFTLKEARHIVQSLEYCDLSVINGNFAIEGGLNLSDALYNETLREGYINTIAVRTEDLSSQFVSDIIDIVYSQEYRQIILQDDTYNNFQLPRNFFDNRDWGSEK